MTEDSDLIMRLLRERRWRIEGILDGTQKAGRRGPWRGARRLFLARVNAEIARRLPASGPALSNEET